MITRLLFYILISFLVTGITACSQETATIDIQTTVLNNDQFSSVYSVCPTELYNDKGIEYFDYTDSCKQNPDNCLTRCLSGNPQFCFSLAYNIQQNENPNEVAYESLYAKSCEFGMPLGCTNRAAGILNMEHTAKGSSSIENPLKCLAETFDKTCEENEPWGCSMSGLVHWQGEGTVKNNELAVSKFEKACELWPESEPCDNSMFMMGQIKLEMAEPKLEKKSE